MTETVIDGGFILLARKLLENGIMSKPHLFLKMWIWMLLQASWKDHGYLKRGQFFTSIERMREAFSYKIGYRLIRPSVKEIRAAYDFLAKGTAIVITKVTHGMIITIVNYDTYQDFINYEGRTEGHNEESTQGTILRKKGIKKEKPPLDFSEISSLEERYSDRELISQCFKSISSTRKTNRISDSVKLNILHQWNKYPADQVMAGIRIYLEKDYAAQGKDEKYLLGIIRGSAQQNTGANITGGKVIKSTGSHLLDRENQRKGFMII